MGSALVVIDVQEALFRPAPRPASAERVFDIINALASRARVGGSPVIFVQHETPAGMTAVNDLTYGSEGWALASELTVASSDHIVPKTTPDAFLKTELDALLKARGVSHLVICGYATEYCVDTTVRRAAGLNYDVTLVADGHTTHDRAHATAAQIVDHHNATLPRLARGFGAAIKAVMSEDVRFQA